MFKGLPLPLNHPGNAGLNNLALLYREQGRLTEAEPLFQKAIAISEKALPADHPDLATWYNNLTTHQKFLHPESLMCLEEPAFDVAEPWGWVGLKRWRRRFGPTLPHGFRRKTRSSARGWRCWSRRRWTFVAST